jgi:hypothetical protein
MFLKKEENDPRSHPINHLVYFRVVDEVQVGMVVINIINIINLIYHMTEYFKNRKYSRNG